VHPHKSEALRQLSLALQGRFSLQVVVFATVILFWIVVLLIACMLGLRGYYYARARYRASRRKVYEPAIEMVLMDEPQDKVVDALAPVRWGDADIVQDVILDSMRHLEGPPLVSLQAAATKTGLMDRNLRLLHSRNKLKRGRAMEALGIMRAHPAMLAIIALLPKLPRDMKLVALRSLSLIGDPFALPYYEREAESLPPTMLPRLASLMLEFGPAAQPFIKKLIRERPEAFPRRVMKLLLGEVAFVLEQR
jgi:hypothetical protein